MSTAIQKDTKAKVESLMGVLMKRSQTFHDLLPPDMGEKRGEWFLSEVKVAAARAPKLADCTTISIVDALTTCAQLGLSPSGRLGSAYLIPYKDKCTLVIGYRGYADLAYRSGDVATFHAEVVYQKDEWVHEEGLEPVLKHRRSEDDDPGHLRAVYAIAKMKDGTSAHVVMLRREVLAIKKRSRASGDGPWVTDESEMWRKTAIRRLIKLLPLSPTKAKWLHRAEETERAQEEAIEGDLVLSDEQPVSGIERAKAAVKALEAKTAGAVASEAASFEPSEQEKAEILAAEHEAAGR
jgi:recombination protein RecT